MDMNVQKVSLLVLILFVLSCGSSEVEEHLSKAGDFRSQGEWQKEIEQYELALGSDKTNAEIWYLKAIALEEIGSEEDVLLSLNNAIKYDGNHVGARYERARKRWQSGLAIEVIEDLNVVLDSNSSNSEAFHLRGRASGSI